ncbi:MAG: DNA-binding PadR family transcriptional regulator [Parvibaculaceae bacterium]|jgi:DNA-binding PadR family transcriptional regulator|nr:PadR family transcriptional regulator [Parvibaculaceae bacterium]
MNTQHLVLSVLIRGAASGYDIKKELELNVSLYLDISPSGIYPALATLTEKGFVEFEKIEQDSRPAKKEYQITESGRQYFFKEMRRIQLRHSLRSEVLYALSIADYLPVDRVEIILNERYEFTDMLLTEMRTRRKEAELQGRHGMAFVLGYGIAASEAANEFVEDEREKFLTNLTDAVRPPSTKPQNR